MRLTKKDVLIIVGIVLITTVFNLFLYSMINKPDAPDYSGYQKQFNQLQETINNNANEIQEIETQIQTVNKYIIQKDSIIDSADGPKLDSLFNDFFNRIRSN